MITAVDSTNTGRKLSGICLSFCWNSLMSDWGCGFKPPISPLTVSTVCSSFPLKTPNNVIKMPKKRKISNVPRELWFGRTWVNARQRNWRKQPQNTGVRRQTNMLGGLQFLSITKGSLLQRFLSQSVCLWTLQNKNLRQEHLVEFKFQPGIRFVWTHGYSNTVGWQVKYKICWYSTSCIFSTSLGSLAFHLSCPIHISTCQMYCRCKLRYILFLAFSTKLVRLFTGYGWNGWWKVKTPAANTTTWGWRQSGSTLRSNATNGP